MSQPNGLPSAFFQSRMESVYTTNMVRTLQRVLQNGDTTQSSVVALFAAFVGAAQAADLDAAAVFQQLLARTEEARREIAEEARTLNGEIAQGNLTLVH